MEIMYVITGLILLLFAVNHVAASVVVSTASGLLQRPKFPSFTTLSVLERIRRGGGSVSKQSTGSKTATTKVESNKSPLQVFAQTIKDGRRHLVAAALARSTSIFIMYPVDAIKTRLQLKQPNPFRLTGLFNGVGGSLLGQVPYGVLSFGSYEMYKQALLDRFPNTKPIWLYAFAAIFGDLTGSGWLCPSEVVKQQVQAGMYPDTGAAIRSIWKSKGLSGFYQGYLGAISRDVPFRVAQLTTFEVTKGIFLQLKRSRIEKPRGKRSRAAVDEPAIELTPIEAALCGAVSGSFSAAITSPLDRIKTLLMTNSQLYGGSVLNCAAKVWREEGLAGFTTGMVPRVVYIAPSVIIFFVVYEMSQQKLKTYWQQQPSRQTK